MISRLLTVFFLLAVSLSAPLHAESKKSDTLIVVEKGWSIPTFSGSTVGVGYFRITNKGDTEDALISASSRRAGMVQIHENSSEKDMITMKSVKSVVIPAGETVSFAPGGLHLMLMQLKQPLVEGEKVDMTLTFEKAGVKKTTLHVISKDKLIR